MFTCWECRRERQDSEAYVAPIREGAKGFCRSCHVLEQVRRTRETRRIRELDSHPPGYGIEPPPHVASEQRPMMFDAYAGERQSLPGTRLGIGFAMLRGFQSERGGRRFPSEK